MAQEKLVAATTDEIGHLYDSLAPFAASIGDNLHFGYWDEPDSEISVSEAVDRLTDIMTNKLKIEPGSHLLDLGCGVGGPGVRIARVTGARVTGISVSREQVRLANSLAQSAGISKRVVFQQINAMEMSFPAQSFDAVIAIESIIHMPDRGRVLAQVSRLLRPGGRLVLTDMFERAPIPPGKQPVIDRFINKLLMATLVRVEDYPPLLRDAGLCFEEIVDITEHSVRKTLMHTLGLISASQLPIFDNTHRSDITALINMPEFGYLMLVAKRSDNGVTVRANVDCRYPEPLGDQADGVALTAKF
jgi:cyclopropane fatty-acyl-phospholipid synthase-like methyltransferase